MKAPTENPYFPYPAMLLLKEQGRELDAVRLEALKLSVALNVADPRAVALFVDLDGDDWLHIYPAAQAPEPMSTTDAIDTFLETFGHSTPQEEALLERMIFNPVPEYSQVLAANAQAPAAEAASEAPASSPASEPSANGVTASSPSTEQKPSTEPAAQTQEQIIDKFLEEYPDETAPAPKDAPAAEPAAIGATASSPSTEPTSARESASPNKGTTAPTLSESLARIFIRQGRYERAFEIISALNLKNPEKSVYFADQLRYLQKVIALQQRRKAARES